MPNNIINVGGQLAPGNTNFTNSPVIVSVQDIPWAGIDSPIKIVRIQIKVADEIAGEFSIDTNGATSVQLDVSTALRAIWSDYNYATELAECAKALNDNNGSSIYSAIRDAKPVSLTVSLEYLDTADGTMHKISSETFDGGQCIHGGSTEMERSLGIVGTDITTLDGSNPRNGCASTKPQSSPERVGVDSITSWVSVGEEGTKQYYYPASVTSLTDQTYPPPPLVLRDTVPHVDFLFVNRRGAVETCSGLMKEAMNIEVESTQYARAENPTFSPVRTLTAIASGGRRSWAMSSGHVTRGWAEWWVLEFLMARQWWMRYKGLFVPVTVTPSKKSTTIYDRTKQQMASVEFTVTLALEG